MKINNIIKVALVAALSVATVAGCQNKKKAAAEAEAARAEAEARASAEAEAARLKALQVFELSEEVALVSGNEAVAKSAEEFQELLKEAKANTAWKSTTFAIPAAQVFFKKEMCDLLPETKAVLDEYINLWKASDKTAVIKIEPYAKDVADKDYNKAIAVERANLIKAYLYAFGLPRKNVEQVCPCKSRKLEDGADLKSAVISIK